MRLRSFFTFLISVVGVVAVAEVLADIRTVGIIVKAVIVIAVIHTLPSSYRQEAKYYFEEQIKEGNSFFITVFDYLLGGIEYRLRQLIFFLSQYLERCANVIREIKQLGSGISNIYCGIRSNM